MSNWTGRRPPCWTGGRRRLGLRGSAYGVDNGFRCDCEPNYGNEMLWARVAKAAKAATGKDILIMEEGTPTWDVPAARSYAFHLSQHDYDSIRFNPALPPIHDFYFGNKTVEQAIKACGEPHATRTITNHDYPKYVVLGRFSAFACECIHAMLAPNLPAGVSPVAF